MSPIENSLNISRRSLIAGMATLPFSYGIGRALRADGDDQAPGLIMREREPQNLESNFASFDSLITPIEKFYIRSHFAAPAVESRSWSLNVEGAVSKPLRISYDELLKLPSETKTATLECAGNGRIYLMPKADGVQWQLGGVGTAEWTGVPLKLLLDRAGLDSKAVEIILEGADTGEPSKPSRPAKPINFSRSLPLDKARDGEVLLAYKMNGEPLPQSHGFPVRAIVPGWYGMASVKWLTRIVATPLPYQGFFQTVDYAYWRHRDGFPVRTAITELQVKSQIARPFLKELIKQGSTYRVFGAAWTGASSIAKVEVSTDGGKSFAAAKLLGERTPYTWRRWEFSWDVPTKPGSYTLMARATDAKGNSQPMDRDRDREAYMINTVLPVEVRVQ
jgi:DMSO/TMAO reductase YedYZ molybdopterin-dependent catalytic subunit